MSEQQSRARGRGRAQARGKAPQPEHGGQQTTGRASTRTPLPGAAGGGAPPPGFRQPPQQQQQHSSGRALHRGAGDPGGIQSRLAGMTIKGDGNGGASGGSGAGGGNGAQIGRGGMRGRRQLPGAEPIRTRPVSCESKKGSSGEKLLLRANYFKLITKPDYTLYQYHVDMAPQEDVTSVRRALLKVHAKVIGPGYLFDGTHLYTFRRLSPDPLELFSKRNHDEQNIQIIIKLVDDIVHGDYHYLQIYNIIIRKCLRNLDLKLLNRNYYDPKAKIQIPEYQLELWPGYLTTMRQHDGGVLLCTEIINKVLRQDNAYDVLTQCIQYDNRQYQNRFKAEIIGQIVLTQYGNTRTYRVDDVDFNATPGSTFGYKGEQISYIKYYNLKYGVVIKNDRQPMLVSRPKARDERAGQDGPIYLVPELCQMTGLTDNMRANNSLMRAMADHTRVGPDQRQQKLLAFNQRFHSVKAITEELGSWQLQLDKQLVQFEGRRLPSEKIVQGNDVTYIAENADWTNHLRSNPLLQCGNLDRWVVITGRRQSHDTHTFIGMVQKAANGMRFRIESPKVEEIADDKPAVIVEALEGVLSRDKPKLVLVVVSNNRADRYNAIKKKTLVDRAVPSQVLNHKTMTRKGAMSIATKVAIQLACKIGGAPWSVDMPLNGLMVVGYDVCHDSQNKQQSYGAMVASLNKALSRYFSTVTSHSCGEEVFNDLPLNIGKAVLKYQAVNKTLPSRIAVYRDGVGDGQIPIVVKHEVEAVKKALSEIYNGKEVMMSFTIVTKRLNTRLFCNRDNPPAGTVVDDCITSPEKYDFFLVSQSVRQGSVSPTGFNIVHDNIGLNADKLQRLSYKLTHLYYNWSGTVRVPAPCQYAHKLAFLVGQNIHRPPNTELEDFLYFL